MASSSSDKSSRTSNWTTSFADVFLKRLNREGISTTELNRTFLNDCFIKIFGDDIDSLFSCKTFSPGNLYIDNIFSKIVAKYPSLNTDDNPIYQTLEATLSYLIFEKIKHKIVTGKYKFHPSIQEDLQFLEKFHKTEDQEVNQFFCLIQYLSAECIIKYFVDKKYIGYLNFVETVKHSRYVSRADDDDDLPSNKAARTDSDLDHN